MKENVISDSFLNKIIYNGIIRIRKLKNFIKYFILFIFLFSVDLLSSCTGSSGFRVKNLVKTDIDVVSDIHLKQTTALLKQLTRKLYKMNSKELIKTPGATINSQIAEIFKCPPNKNYKDLQSKDGIDAILLGLEPDYKGDRVLAMMYGLYTMIHKSYSGNCELYMANFLNQQSLYNSARNIEIFVWRLKKRYRPDGELFLETNQVKGSVENLSFERIFGQLISLQDTMALIVSSRTGRMITNFVYTAARMTFIPIKI